VQLQSRAPEASARGPTVWRASVVAVAVYVVLFAILGIWILVTGRHARLGAPAEPLIGAPSFLALCGVNLTFLVLLALDWRRALESDATVRRGQLVGLALAIAVVLGVQASVLAMRGVTTG
jgi:hypothetical protein